VAEDLSDRIASAADEPASVSVDGQSVTDRGVNDLIAADQYTNNKAAVATQRTGWACVRRAALKPPGAV